MIERITHQGRELAIIIPHSHLSQGIEFFTSDAYSQQLGYMNRRKGYVISPHVHNPIPRQVTYTQETLFVRSGYVRVDFYNERGGILSGLSAYLEGGDAILLVAGGHGFEFLEDSQVIEVKQGPYTENDKRRL